MGEVPTDLITKILQWLPVKTLLRFKCVSKSLCRIIDSSEFINSHLTRTRTHCKIIIGHCSQLEHLNPVPLHLFDIDGPFPQELRKQHRARRYMGDDSYRFSAHCNGLVVLVAGDNDFSLVSLGVWNPSIRKYRKLPDLPYKEETFLNTRVCFGYDSSIDDYKVMVVKEINQHENKIWILGLRSGYWRRIELPRDFKNCHIDCYFRNCLLDGAFYFLCVNDVILAFDLAKETFSRVFVPDFITPEQYDETSLMVLEECLCVGLWQEEQAELHVRKKNDGGEFSWTKLLTIKFQETQYPSEYEILMHSEVLGFSRDGGKIYVLHDEDYVYSYDFKEKNIELLVVGDIRKQKMFSCIESLVWVDDNKRKRKRETKRKKKPIPGKKSSLGIKE